MPASAISVLRVVGTSENNKSKKKIESESMIKLSGLLWKMQDRYVFKKFVILENHLRPNVAKSVAASKPREV